MSSPINLRHPGRPIRVGVVFMNSVTEHLDIAPAAFFPCISREFLQRAPPNLVSDDLLSQALEFEHHWITEDGKDPARFTGNMKVAPTIGQFESHEAHDSIILNSFAHCPPLDIIVLGAYATGYQVSETEKQFLRRAYTKCAALLCVCAGFLPVLAAGILERKTLTAPAPMLPVVRQIAPGTT